jgi:CheY-like chemotaxis protein
MDLKALRLLIVDDNRHASEIVRSILASVGAQDIVMATTVERAFTLLQAETFDLLIVDQNLGKGDEGIALVRRLRQDPKSVNPYLPVLMLTGYTEQRRVQGPATPASASSSRSPSPSWGCCSGSRRSSTSPGHS